MIIQSHLKKLFAGIHTVEFNDNASEIVAMRSLEGELVLFKTTVTISAEVEVRNANIIWLLNFKERGWV